MNPKTIAKWKKRDDPSDRPMGPKVIQSTVLSEGEEKAIVAFRQMTQLPLDDLLYSLQEPFPHLSHVIACIAVLSVTDVLCCLKKQHLSKLKRSLKEFKACPLGFFHIDIAEVHTEEGKLYLYVAIDRTSKFAYTERHKEQTKKIAADFLTHLIQSVPYTIHKILTDHGIAFTNHTHHKYAFVHIFDRVCLSHHIKHRKTQVKHPWTNGQVERMNRTIKDATVHTFHYASHEKLKKHLHAYLMAYHFAKRLKTLKGNTPWQFICKQWDKTPQKINTNPNHFLTGLNI